MELPINQILNGDSLSVLKTLPSESINCVMTSPPYWALRDYGVEGQLGLEPTFDEYIKKLCDIFDEVKRVLRKDGTCFVNLGDTYFTKSGSGFANDNLNPLSNEEINISNENRAWLGALIDGEGCLQIHKQIRENYVDSYQADISVGMKDKEMVEYAHRITNLGNVTLQNRGVYDWGVRGQEAGKLARIIYPYLKIKKRQSILLNLLCENSKRGIGKTNGKNTKPEDLIFREKLFILNRKLNQREDIEFDFEIPKIPTINSNISDKSLCNIPARFSIEMQNRGWILRNVIIWHKPNCMPSSVKDRFTVDFEYLYFFVKNKNYWFETQYEPIKSINDPRVDSGREEHIGKSESNTYSMNSTVINSYGRNKRTVWTITTKPFKESHFAVFPEELCYIPIKAGCPEFVCNKCGKARERIFDNETYGRKAVNGLGSGEQSSDKPFGYHNYSEKGYTSCSCNAPFVQGIVLDPFFGAGTTGLVALKQNKNFIGIELNPKYIEIANKRLKPFLEQTKL